MIAVLVLVVLAAAVAVVLVLLQQRQREEARRNQAAQLSERQRWEQAERERLAREKVEHERLVREQAERERLAREQAERERLAQEQTERDRLAREEAERRRLEQERLTPTPVALDLPQLVAAFLDVYPLVSSEAIRVKLRPVIAGAGLPVPGEAAPAESAPAADRDQRIETAIAVLDMTRKQEVLGPIRAALAAEDVEILDPVGQRFDPEQHQAMGTEPTSDPAQHEIVERTAYPGYRDLQNGGRVLRDPKVIVYIRES